MRFNSIHPISNSIQAAGSHIRTLATVALIVIASCCAPQSAVAQQLTSASTSRQFKQQAIEAIPFEMLTQQTQANLNPILEKPSIYRRLPKMAIECDPDYFRFLIRHPEVVVEIWKLMGVSKMTTNRTAPYKLESNDGAGTISELELVYGDGQKHIFFGTGSYEGPLMRRKLTGRCVLVLQTQHGVDEDGNPRAVNQLDVFLKVDNVAASVIARSLSPLVGPTADHNFMESLKFIEKLHRTTVRNGPGVQLMGNRLDLQPSIMRGFQQMAGTVFQRGNQVPSATDARVSSGPQIRSFRSR